MKFCKVTLFEDDRLRSFNSMSGNESDSIENELSFIHDNEIHTFCDEDEEHGKYKSDININCAILLDVNGETIKKYIDKKTLIKPPNYSINDWGKVEILVEYVTDKEMPYVLDVINQYYKYNDKFNEYLK